MLVPSSTIKIRASLSNARARPNSWRCPKLRDILMSIVALRPPSPSITSQSPTFSRAACISASEIRGLQGIRLCLMVPSRKTGSCGRTISLERTTSREIVVRSRLSMKICPSVISRKRKIVSIREVLPLLRPRLGQ